VRVNILVNEIAGGWEPTDTRLGGTEESVVRWSEELVRRGHEVRVYRNPRNPVEAANSVYDLSGIRLWYSPRENYHGDGDVCINIKSSEVAPKEPTIYFTNETNASDLDLSAYKAVVWPSQWAKDNIAVNNPNVLVVPHGYDPDKIYPKKKVLKQCLYASSPDRGLDTLAQIWPSVVAQHPDAQLIVTYGGITDAPNTECVGNVDEEEMCDLFNTSDLWIHPCNGGELFGITGIKAQAAGAIPVYFPTMALSETVKVGVPCTDARDMYTKLIQLLDDEDKKGEYREQLASLKLPTWETSTDALEAILTKQRAY
jgi:glycosyltransferase involved in cell wall biosynthesis